MPGLGGRFSRRPTLLLLLLGLAAASAAGRSADSSSPSSSEEERKHHHGGQEHQHRHQRYRQHQREGEGIRSHHHRAPELGLLPFPPDTGAVLAGERGNMSSGGEMMCEEARMRCAFRSGCGEALQRFVGACSEIAIGVRHGAHAREEMPTCSEPCQHALIALTSTEEGQALITCRCSDESCESAKRRASACAPAVAAASRPDAVLPCRVAQWVCSADPLCSTALGFYQRLCRSAFSGRKCTPRCRNSAAILQRQPKAAGLSSCRCDGREDYDCDLVRRNTERLCFHRDPPPPLNPPPMAGEIPLIPVEEGKRPGAAIGDTDTNEIMRISGALAGGRSGAPKTAYAMQLVLIAAIVCIRGFAWSTDLLLGLNS